MNNIYGPELTRMLDPYSDVNRKLALIGIYDLYLDCAKCKHRCLAITSDGMQWMCDLQDDDGIVASHPIDAVTRKTAPCKLFGQADMSLPEDECNWCDKADTCEKRKRELAKRDICEKTAIIECEEYGDE